MNKINEMNQNLLKTSSRLQNLLGKIKQDFPSPIYPNFSKYSTMPLFLDQTGGVVTYTNNSNTFWSTGFTALTASCHSLKQLFVALDPFFKLATNENELRIYEALKFSSVFPICGQYLESIQNNANIQHIDHIDQEDDNYSSSQPFIVSTFDFKRFDNQNKKIAFRGSKEKEINLILSIYASFEFLNYLVFNNIPNIVNNDNMGLKNETLDFFTPYKIKEIESIINSITFDVDRILFYQEKHLKHL